jgi:enoyl-CoA hydratase/carnithine racemase
MKKVEAIQNNLNSGKSLRVNGHIDVEDRGPVLVARIDGGSHALFDAALVKQLKELVDRADSDPKVHAVVFTGTHPDRFLSHSDVTGRCRIPADQYRLRWNCHAHGEIH